MKWLWHPRQRIDQEPRIINSKYRCWCGNFRGDMAMLILLMLVVAGHFGIRRFWDESGPKDLNIKDWMMTTLLATSLILLLLLGVGALCMEAPIFTQIFAIFVILDGLLINGASLAIVVYRLFKYSYKEHKGDHELQRLNTGFGVLMCYGGIWIWLGYLIRLHYTFLRDRELYKEQHRDPLCLPNPSLSYVSLPPPIPPETPPPSYESINPIKRVLVV